MSKLDISLNPELEAYVRVKVDSGLYNNASEVIRDSLRLMLRQDQTYESSKSAIRGGFEQIEAGDSVLVGNRDEFFKLARARRSKNSCH